MLLAAEIQVDRLVKKALEGATMGLTDIAGTLKDTSSYDPFGKLASSTTPNHNIWNFQATSPAARYEPDRASLVWRSSP
ncbi:MAG: hypothetical protein M3Z66_21855 [Chloroflexota bacterium]|nr:hypothetical protein [Chloroflexota bacterium]